MVTTASVGTALPKNPIMVIEQRSSIQGNPNGFSRVTDEIIDTHETERLVKPKCIKVNIGNVIPNGRTPFEETNCHEENTQQKGKDIVICIL